jgi:hypothetical protein
MLSCWKKISFTESGFYLSESGKSLSGIFCHSIPATRYAMAGVSVSRSGWQVCIADGGYSLSPASSSQRLKAAALSALTIVSCLAGGLSLINTRLLL